MRQGLFVDGSDRPVVRDISRPLSDLSTSFNSAVSVSSVILASMLVAPMIGSPEWLSSTVAIAATPATSGLISANVPAPQEVRDFAPMSRQDDDEPSRKKWSQPRMPARPEAVRPDPVLVDRVVRRAVARLLELQEVPVEEVGQPEAVRCEWPYECAYQNGKGSPIAFRVGGTSIVGLALLAAPGLASDMERRAALARAADMVARTAEHEQITFENEAAVFDLRNWAHCFGLRFLLAADKAGVIPDERRPRIRAAISKYASSLLHTAHPARGGWNYFRQSDADLRQHTCTFLSAHCVIALVEARDAGVEPVRWESPEGLVEPPPYDATIVRALDAIDSARRPDGFLGYDTRRSGALGGPYSKDHMPDCVGRRLIADVAAARAGRLDIDRLRSSLVLFDTTWRDLDAERGRGGVHRAPFGIAPYYFFFACTAAAEAAQFLPPNERDRHLAFNRALVLSICAPDGTWNDQHYLQSVAYGTASAILVLVDPAKRESVPKPGDSEVPAGPVKGLDRGER